jgi:hypothetical protein
MKSLRYFLALSLMWTVMGCASTTTPTQEKPSINNISKAIESLKF